MFGVFNAVASYFRHEPEEQKTSAGYSKRAVQIATDPDESTLLYLKTIFSDMGDIFGVLIDFMGWRSKLHQQYLLQSCWDNRNIIGFLTSYQQFLITIIQKTNTIKGSLPNDDSNLKRLSDFQKILQNTLLAIKGSIVERRIILGLDNGLNQEFEQETNLLSSFRKTLLGLKADTSNEVIPLSQYPIIVSEYKSIGVYNSASTTLFQYLCKDWVAKVNKQVPIAVSFNMSKSVNCKEDIVDSFKVHLNEAHSEVFEKIEPQIACIDSNLAEDTKRQVNEYLKSSSVTTICNAITEQAKKAKQDEEYSQNMIREFNRVYAALYAGQSSIYKSAAHQHVLDEKQRSSINRPWKCKETLEPALQTQIHQLSLHKVEDSKNQALFESIKEYAKQYPHSRTAQALSLAMKYSGQCKGTNHQLVKEIHAIAYAKSSFFSKTVNSNVDCAKVGSRTWKIANELG